MREESLRFEQLLRDRGTSSDGNLAVEKNILERYQDDCAVLVLDSSGFTRLTQKHGIIHFLSLVVAMHDMARPIFEEHEAISHWSHSDNLFAIFPTARAAVECSIRVQRRIIDVNEKRPLSEQLEASIGVGCGKMLRIGKEDIYGDPMNLACKLGEDIAGAREILITEPVFDEVKSQMTGVDFVPQSLVVKGVDMRYYKLAFGGDVTWTPARK